MVIVVGEGGGWGAEAQGYTPYKYVDLSGQMIGMI